MSGDSTSTETVATNIEAATPEPSAGAPSTGQAPTPTGEPVGHAPSGHRKYGYFWGLGRRKSAVARVRIREGSGTFLVNKRPIDDYFKRQRDRDDVIAPLKATESAKHLDVFVNVQGGGTTGQAGAIVLGLARALRAFDVQFEGPLRAGRYLTRDSRKVERKKYGQRGARRRFQFSKR